MVEQEKPLFNIEDSLPEWLHKSLDNFEEKYQEYLEGKNSVFDCDIMEFNSDINVAEVEGQISHYTAQYLRTEYLKMEYD